MVEENSIIIDLDVMPSSQKTFDIHEKPYPLRINTNNREETTQVTQQGSVVEEVEAFTYILEASQTNRRNICRRRRQSNDWQSNNSISTTRELEYQFKVRLFKSSIKSVPLYGP